MSLLLLLIMITLLATSVWYVYVVCCEASLQEVTGWTERLRADPQLYGQM